jgi:hypothetical protein
MADEAIAYNKEDLRGIYKAFKGMSEEAITAAKQESNALATYLQGRIVDKALTRDLASIRIATGATVSKSSKTGDISIGFARQKFSGGGTTQQLWAGYEFGSNKFRQFPIWSGKFGRGSKGWFIYPTLRAEQPYILNEWENAFSRILKEFD